MSRSTFAAMLRFCDHLIPGRAEHRDYDGGVGAALERRVPSFPVAGRGYAVGGLVEERGVATGPGRFTSTGSITGDIAGDVVTQLTRERVNGGVEFLGGEQTWEVTGGNFGALIGRRVRLRIEVMNMFGARFFSARPPRGLLHASGRVIDGAARGNVTYYGTIDPPVHPFVVELEYHGEICP